MFDPTHPDFDPYADIINERIIVNRSRMQEAGIAGLALVFNKKGTTDKPEGQLKIVDWANQLQIDTVDVGSLLKEMEDEKSCVLVGRLHNEKKKICSRD